MLPKSSTTQSPKGGSLQWSVRPLAWLAWTAPARCLRCWRVRPLALALAHAPSQQANTAVEGGEDEDGDDECASKSEDEEASLASASELFFSEQPRMRRPVRALPRWPCLEPRSQPNQVPAARARRLLLPGSARGFPNRWRAACKGGTSGAGIGCRFRRGGLWPGGQCRWSRSTQCVEVQGADSQRCGHAFQRPD